MVRLAAAVVWLPFATALAPRRLRVRLRAEPEVAAPVAEAPVEAPTTTTTTTTSAAPTANAAYACSVEGVELCTESALAYTKEGRGAAYLFKAECTVPGAAVLAAFDGVRESAKKDLNEPGFRPGDVPPWIKLQLTEFALTSVMEDVIKNCVDANGLEIVEGTDGEDVVRWDEDPNAVSKTFVLGSDFTFHAAFNATAPADPSVAKAQTLEDLFSLTPSKVARAAKVLKDGGRVPGLLSQGGSSAKKGSAKKAKPKKKR